jgi:hypothetical protein
MVKERDYFENLGTDGRIRLGKKKKKKSKFIPMLN